MIEVWRVIASNPQYDVSNQGRVRRGEKVLANSRNYNGYSFVRLKKKKCYVHRLVAAAFLGDCDKLDINHKNGVKSDNRLENLEIVTRSENMAHARLMGLHNNYADGHYARKLTSSDVRFIRENHPSLSFLELASRFGVNKRTIEDAFFKRTWKSVL